MSIFAAAGSSPAFDIGLTATAFGFGFRHGIDWDHIAAIADLNSSQPGRRRSIVLATLYALGHALVVGVLGVLAIVFAERVPADVDTIMERVVGATLVILGVYVVYGLFRHRRQFRMRSRWMLLIAVVRRAFGCVPPWRRRVEVIEVVHDHEHPIDEPHDHTRLPVHLEAGHIASPARDISGASGRCASGGAPAHRHVHRHVGTLPADPFAGYGSRAAFGIGMLHGVGAETPTQVLIFLTAAGAGGAGAGVTLLGCFILGLLASNSVIALAAALGFGGATRSFTLYAAVALITAAFSLSLGVLLLLGRGSALPPLPTG